MSTNPEQISPTLPKAAKTVSHREKHGHGAISQRHPFLIEETADDAPSSEQGTRCWWRENRQTGDQRKPQFCVMTEEDGRTENDGLGKRNRGQYSFMIVYNASPGAQNGRRATGFEQVCSAVCAAEVCFSSLLIFRLDPEPRSLCFKTDAMSLL